MQYRKARLDEVQEVAQVCADAFEDYPYLSMIATNLKKPEQYEEFVLALQEMLVRLAIKRDSCLVAEKDGRIVAAAILQHQTISMLNYLQNGATKLFRFISITKLFKYFNFVEESKDIWNSAGIRLVPDDVSSNSRLSKKRYRKSFLA
ncbi:MAG: hypothetical protein ACLS6Y_00140 [Streptococcus salivarius]